MCVRVCVWACARVCVCGFGWHCLRLTEERMSESGLSVISVTLSVRLHLTNERCWQLVLSSPGSAEWDGFVSWPLSGSFSLLPSLFLPLPLLTECQGEQWPLVSPKDTSWHSAQWQIDHGGQGVSKLPQRWRGFECSIRPPPGPETADLVRMGKTGKSRGMSSCQKWRKIGEER